MQRIACICVLLCSIEWGFRGYESLWPALAVGLLATGFLIWPLHLRQDLPWKTVVCLLCLFLLRLLLTEPLVSSENPTIVEVVTRVSRPRYGICRLIVEQKGRKFQLYTPDLPWNPACKAPLGSSFRLERVRYREATFDRDPFSYGSYLRRKGLSGTIYAPVMGARVSKQSYFDSRWDPLLNSFGEREGFAILAATVLGESDLLHPSTEELFQIGGLSHLLVVSGFHVGVLFFFFTQLFSVLWKNSLTLCSYFPRQLAVPLLSLCFVLAYGCSIGLRPPVLRALLMLSCFVLARLSAREGALGSSLLLAFLVTQFVWPGSYLELGVQLSFGAIVAMTFCAQKLKPQTYWAKSIVFSLSAWATTSFILYQWFGEFSIYGAVTNLWFTPLFSIIGICFGGISFCLSLLVGPSILEPAVVSVEYLLWILRLFFI